MADIVESWFDRLEERRWGQAEELNRIIMAADARLERAIKWGRLTFTLDGNWHHWLCGIAAPTTGTKLVFHKGALLEDPHGLLTGTARYTREVPAEEAIGHPGAIQSLLASAIAHQTDLLD